MKTDDYKELRGELDHIREVLTEMHKVLGNLVRRSELMEEMLELVKPYMDATHAIRDMILKQYMDKHEGPPQ